MHGWVAPPHLAQSSSDTYIALQHTALQYGVSAMTERLTHWIEALFAPAFEMLRGVPPRAMMHLLTPF
jgi:hypothetical protein